MKISYSAIVFLLWSTAGSTAGLTPATDLAADAERAARENQPLVVMFSSDACPYCQTVLRYLTPLAEDPKYRNRVPVRLVETHDGDRELVDFDGQRRSHAGFAHAQGVDFVPVVRFFGPKGVRLAPDLVGLGLEDFYLPYLLNRIDAARAKLRRVPDRANDVSNALPREYAGG